MPADAIDHIAAAGPNEVFRLVDLLAGQQSASAALMDATLERLVALSLLDSDDLQARLAVDSAWQVGPVGRRLVAHLHEARRDWPNAVAQWTQVIDNEPGIDQEAYLARARARFHDGDVPCSFLDLRLAATGIDDFNFLSRAAKLYRRLRQNAPPPALRRAKVAVLSSTTTALAAPLLELACFREGIDATVYEAPFGSFRQEILDPNSGLYALQPDLVLIATHWRDADLPPFADQADALIERVVADCRQLWTTLLGRLSCRVVQHGFDLPTERSFGQLSNSLPGGLARMLREVNRRLTAEAPSAVTILDLEHVAARCGAESWSDPTIWHLAKQHPASTALPILVNHQVALFRAHLGLSKKVLVFDLDNTLWGGIIGEDGLENIEVGPPSAVGEAYQALQQYAKELKSRGILLAVCSKNNEADAKLPFEKHDGMLLHLDDFAAFRADWNDKPSNLRLLADQLSLGLDSFVFVDDNPTERAFVRRELPEVAVPELGSDPAQFVKALDGMLYYEAIALSEEDRQRHKLYQDDAARRELHQASASLDEFLRELHMEADIGPVSEAVLARIVQLLGKTNQFNLTSRRHSESLVREMVASPNWWTQCFKLRDRFGDYGLIGLMLARSAEYSADTWEIDTWLMSCRVIGRRIEDLMFQTLAQAAIQRGVRRLRGVYRPTAKNNIVSDLYPRMGFQVVGQADGAQIYERDLSVPSISPCDMVRVHAMH